MLKQKALINHIFDVIFPGEIFTAPKRIKKPSVEKIINACQNEGGKPLKIENAIDLELLRIKYESGICNRDLPEFRSDLFFKLRFRRIPNI